LNQFWKQKLGDSGGPLLVVNSGDNKNYLVGLTSFGFGCGTSFPSIYTRVSSYIDWIEEKVWPDL
jgi:secreted trypsin-like serine protease